MIRVKKLVELLFRKTISKEVCVGQTCCLPTATTPLGYTNKVERSLIKLYPEYKEDIRDSDAVAIQDLIDSYYPSGIDTINVANRIGERLGYTY